MLNNFSLGQYFPGNSPVHRLDPRTKLLITIALIVFVFLAEGFSGFIAIAAFILAATVISGIRIKFLLKGLKPLLFIILFTFILNLFFQTQGTVLVQLGFLKITLEGLRTAVFTALRLVLLVAASQMLTLTTSPIALTDGIESLLKPLTRFNFPAHEIAMMMSIALRFIPTLMEEADKIMKAQKARGADFESGNIIERAKAMVPLLVPLFVGSFRRADELALAMEARCYRGGTGRTRMNQLSYGKSDLFAALITALLLALILIFNGLNWF